MTHSAARFIDLLQNSHLPQSRPPASKSGFSEYTLDMRRLKLNLSVYVPFLTLVQEDSTIQEREGFERLLLRLIEYSRQYGSGSPIVFLTMLLLPPEFLEHPDLQKHSIAIFDLNIHEALSNARDYLARYQFLGTAMARAIGHAALSPYAPGSPVSSNRFFGREEQLKRILSGKTLRSSTIVGNRRIGKTSMMHEIRERLKQVYTHGKTMHFAELYGSKCKTTWDAVYLILDQIGVPIPKNIAKYGAIAPRFIHRMPQLLHGFARTNQTQIVLFIDEFDELAERDALQKWEFTHLLRETAMAELNCYVIVAGFRYLMQMRTRQDSPLYNFTEEIQLTPLTREETLDMVNSPLSRLGIDITRSNIPAIIHRETRGQPELIQMYCQAIIQSVSRRGVPPSEAELLKLVNQNPAFNRTITHTFLSNANDFEQVICLELMKRAASSQQGVAQFEFRVSDIEEILSAYCNSLTNSQIATLINNLCVGSFIERVKGSGAPGLYHFATPQLVRFCQDVGLDGLLTRAVQKLGNNPPVIDALSQEPSSDSFSAGVR